MKKILPLLLCLCLIFGMAINVHAEEPVPEENTLNMEEYMIGVEKPAECFVQYTIKFIDVYGHVVDGGRYTDNLYCSGIYRSSMIWDGQAVSYSVIPCADSPQQNVFDTAKDYTLTYSVQVTEEPNGAWTATTTYPAHIEEGITISELVTPYPYNPLGEDITIQGSRDLSDIQITQDKNHCTHIEGNTIYIVYDYDYEVDDCYDGYGHNWHQVVDKATFKKDGLIYNECSKCGIDERFGTPIGRISDVMLSKTKYTFNGKERKPKVTLQTVDGDILSENNYKVKYSDNVHAGTASVKITMTGDYYAGSKTVHFTINPAANTLSVKGKNANVSYAKVKKGDQTIPVSSLLKFTDKGQGSKKYSLKSVSKNKKYFEIDSKTGALTIKKKLPKGEYTLKIGVQAKGNSDYKKSEVKTVTVKLTNK